MAGALMEKVTDRWFSERLQQPITMARWGHFGTPVLIFPTAGGDAEEIERMRLIAACSELIEAGRVKIYSCDSVAGKAMVAAEGTPAYRMWLMNQFHDCVINEIVPAIHPISADMPRDHHPRAPPSAPSTRWP